MIIKKTCYAICDALGQPELSYQCFYLNEVLVIQIVVILIFVIAGFSALTISKDDKQ